MTQGLRVDRAERGVATLAVVLLTLTAISMIMTMAEIQRGARGGINADAMAKALEATPARWSADVERAYAEKHITAYQRGAMLQQLTDVIPVFKESARKVRNAGVDFENAILDEQGPWVAASLFSAVLLGAGEFVEMAEKAPKALTYLQRLRKVKRLQQSKEGLGAFGNLDTFVTLIGLAQGGHQVFTEGLWPMPFSGKKFRGKTDLYKRLKEALGPEWSKADFERAFGTSNEKLIAARFGHRVAWLRSEWRRLQEEWRGRPNPVVEEFTLSRAEVERGSDLDVAVKVRLTKEADGRLVIALLDDGSELQRWMITNPDGPIEGPYVRERNHVVATGARVGVHQVEACVHLEAESPEYRYRKALGERASLWAAAPRRGLLGNESPWKTMQEFMGWLDGMARPGVGLAGDAERWKRGAFVTRGGPLTVTGGGADDRIYFISPYQLPMEAGLVDFPVEVGSHAVVIRPWLRFLKRATAIDFYEAAEEAGGAEMSRRALSDLLKKFPDAVGGMDGASVAQIRVGAERRYYYGHRAPGGLQSLGRPSFHKLSAGVHDAWVEIVSEGGMAQQAKLEVRVTPKNLAQARKQKRQAEGRLKRAREWNKDKMAKGYPVMYGDVHQKAIREYGFNAVQLGEAGSAELLTLLQEMRQVIVYAIQGALQRSGIGPAMGSYLGDVNTIGSWCMGVGTPEAYALLSACLAEAEKAMQTPTKRKDGFCEQALGGTHYFAAGTAVSAGLWSQVHQHLERWLFWTARAKKLQGKPFDEQAQRAWWPPKGDALERLVGSLSK